MDVLVLVVLVDPGPGLEQRLHEQVQEGRHPNLRDTSLERNARNRCQVSPHTLAEAVGARPPTPSLPRSTQQVSQSVRGLRM